MKITLNTFFRWLWLLDRVVDDDVDAMAVVCTQLHWLGYAMRPGHNDSPSSSVYSGRYYII